MATIQERLEDAKDKLDILDRLRDNITLHRRTSNLADLMTAVGEYVDNDLYDAIRTFGDAIDEINKLEDRVSELESKQGGESNVKTAD